MSQSLQIFIEYKVKESRVNEYEAIMKAILDTLPEFGASDVQWFVADDQPHLYVEMFKVPTQAHYIALKKLRQSDEHHLFGRIAPLIEGGCEKIHCWAFKGMKGREA